MIEDIFPTPIGMYDYIKPMSEKELDFIDNLKYVANQGNFISDVKTLLDYPEMKKLRFFFNKCLAEYITETLAPPDTVRHYITHCWANRTNLGEYHHVHKHPNSIVSGVFYIKTVNDRDFITFTKDDSQMFVPIRSSYNNYNATHYDIKATERRLILFPSNLAHQVKPLEGDVETRVSISFNTFITGSIDSGISDENYINLPIIDYG